MEKKILGLDLGTNSIGWSLIEQDFENKQGKIIGIGTRVIPMSQDKLSEFGKGNSVSQTAERTGYRSVRRLRERYLLRRERLHRILNLLQFLPEHYAACIDFEKRLGKFINNTEPKLAYTPSGEFIFKSSFLEMLEDFKRHQPEFLKNEKGEDRLIPYDWTIYYLRKKALTQKIEKEELAWLLLNFNQKRGYYQLRGEEEEENPNKLIEFHSLKVIEVKADPPQKGKDDIWYSLILENGWIYRRSSKIDLADWKDKVRDFIVTTDLNDDGSVKKDKEGHEKRSFRAPGADDWTLLKKKTEREIERSQKTVGTFIYDTLLINPKQKIKGQLVKTIERKFYKDELRLILEKQKEFHPVFNDETVYNACIKELYRYNESHQMLLGKKDIVHLFLSDIIFYQRPLKSKKSSIGNCTLECRTYKDAEDNEIKVPIKAVSKSHPLYQEFRLWQWLSNLKIYRREDDKEVTLEFLGTIKQREDLFNFLNHRKEIKQDSLIKFLLEDKGLKGKALTTEVAKFRWNFIDDKEKAYPCNETKALIESRLEKVQDIKNDFLTPDTEEQLWHLIYSVTDKLEYEKALASFARRHNLHISSFVDSFKKFPPFKPDYGSYSLKALKKLVPLLRTGNYWNWETIDSSTKARISKIITGEYDETIKDKVREKAISLKQETDFQNLPLWLASYVVYDRHSEAAMTGKWYSIKDMEEYITAFKQHSLRNPIVEQVVVETLRVVKDIWSQYGSGKTDFFDEIHIELGREMKHTADERKRLTNTVTENETTNARIKALLAELKNDTAIENVRPYSPVQQDLLKLYEEGVLNSTIDVPDDILKISKTAQPSAPELLRYKLWLEQKYRSPYTGETIPLTKLFTPDYEIEHIIPRSRFFDDSFSNKVICEAAVNRLKDNQLGFEFIKYHKGKEVETNFGNKVRIMEPEQYENFVKEHYAKNRVKKTKLLLEDIPEKMIARQMNDTRYISKFISGALSYLVRKDKNDDGINSVNLVFGNGKITTQLKQDWGLNDIWNELILSRFERMNAITGSKSYTAYNEKYQKDLPTVPIEQSKGFQKKRIDHRHHALDALIIACATRNHVNYLNNQHALDKTADKKEKQVKREDLRAVLCEKKYNSDSDKNYQWLFKKPWSSFTLDTRQHLEKTVVSFKQNTRVITKTNNRYESYKTEDGALRIGKDGKPKKELTPQTKGDSKAIRKSMHQDTVGGLIKLKKYKKVSLSSALDNPECIANKKLRRAIQQLVREGLDKKKILARFKESDFIWNSEDISKTDVYYWELDHNGNGLNVASRQSIDISFTEDRIKDTVADTAIQKILLNHLANYQNRKDEKGKPVAPETIAFTPEGIEEMNKNIRQLNNGKFHQPIFKVRTYEPKGMKFTVGQTGNKTSKLVIAAKGSNLFFTVYKNEESKRVFETLPLNEVIEHQKWRATLEKEEQLRTPLIPIKKELGTFLFSLSPNDLVYLPSGEEREQGNRIDFSNLTKEQQNNIYKVVSFTGYKCFFVKHDVASSIIDKLEFSVLNKMERSIDGQMIKECCMKLKVNRLGKITVV
ncbi:MAG: HNH endonuclease domain-containing protein [Sediminibacterium sp.]|nr:HNH endonuclease domain-containing protein [Sediminibacterium sp.]